jgi:hypothetical protein
MLSGSLHEKDQRRRQRSSRGDRRLQIHENFELMKNIKNQYVKADSAKKHRIMKILVSNCELKGVNTRIY